MPAEHPFRRHVAFRVARCCGPAGRATVVGGVRAAYVRPVRTGHRPGSRSGTAGHGQHVRESEDTIATRASADPPTEVYLSLGSNLGDREAHLRHALRRLSGRAGELAGVSRVYETEPVGFEAQPRFLNLVARVDTTLEPLRLLEVLRGIEDERGRERTFRNAPRTLDIDILLYGDRRIARPGLTVPHPRMAERAFVLAPLLELAPALVEPGTGTPYREYLDPEASGVRALFPGEELLERE